MKIVKAIREGRIVPRKPSTEPKPQFYGIWSESDAPTPDHPMHMPAPKVKPPSHAESYNPPPEYLFDETERKEWESAEPEDRKLNFIPHSFNALRKVPGYSQFISERFQRCLDLYMAPRVRRKKRADETEEPEDLLPKLPSPSELKPFPTTVSLTYAHPNDVRVRSVSISPDGSWLATGAEDGRARLWELATGRCAVTWDMYKDKVERAPIFSVEWSPEKDKLILAVVS